MLVVVIRHLSIFALVIMVHVIIYRIVNITVLVLLPTVLAILFVCSIDIGIGDSFSLIFLAIFDTNTFVIRCIS